MVSCQKQGAHHRGQHAQQTLAPAGMSTSRYSIGNVGLALCLISFWYLSFSTKKMSGTYSSSEDGLTAIRWSESVGRKMSSKQRQTTTEHKPNTDQRSELKTKYYISHLERAPWPGLTLGRRRARYCGLHLLTQQPRRISTHGYQSRCNVGPPHSGGRSAV